MVGIAETAELAGLAEAVGGRVSTVATTLESHGRDENYRDARAPLAVVYATSVADVQAALAWCREAGVALIPYAAGTSLEGSLVPVGSAVSLDLSGMNKVLEVRVEDFAGKVEPGITRSAFNSHLAGTGLFFPVDPGADASLGGMAATNASGTTTVRYGGMRANVLALQVVLASGEVLELGRPVRKTSSGYDLKDLFIGSAGTLGIITQLTVSLHPLPEHVHTLRVFFDEVEQAAAAAYSIMALGLPVARLELVDELSMRGVNSYLHTSYPERPGLFVEFHSSSIAAMEAEAETAVEAARDAGGALVEMARTPEERQEQWRARHQLYPAFRQLHPGWDCLIGDTAVPLSKLTNVVAHARRLAEELNLEVAIIGHVGDGNFHALVAVPPDGVERAELYTGLLVKHSLSVGGTATGEHGIGLAKRAHLEDEHGPAVAWMRQVKALFDPGNVLNPGKIL
ncbi:MAG: FAD-binding oxidoreductase [Acidimicrobiales bacterium]